MSFLNGIIPIVNSCVGYIDTFVSSIGGSAGFTGGVGVLISLVLVGWLISITK